MCRLLSAIRQKASRYPLTMRSRGEHVFAAQKCRLGLLDRTVRLIRDRMANLAFNFTRLAWLNARTAPA